MTVDGNSGFVSSDAKEALQLLAFLAAESNATVWQVDLVTMQSSPLTDFPFLGYSPDEIPNSLDVWLTLIHPSDLAGAHEQIAELIGGERGRIEIEHRVRHHDGTWRWLRTSAVVQKRSPEGKPLVMQGVCVEITHPRHTERLLKMSRESLAQFGQASSLEELLEGLATAVQQQMDDAIAGILVHEASQDPMRLAAGADIPRGLRLRFQKNASVGCLDMCASTTASRNTFVGSIHESPWCDHCRAAALAAGFNGCAMAGIFNSKGESLGSFLLFFPEARSATRHEDELLQASAQLAAVAIEQWRNLALLRRSEERLERAMWGAALGLWDANFLTGNVYFSDHWNQMLGYQPGEFPTRVDALLSIVHEDDREGLLKAWHDHAEGRTPYFESEHRLQAKDGRWIWVCDRARIVERSETGQPLRASGTQYEISQRKEIELELRQSEARFQAFMEHLPAIAFIKNRRGEYLFGNPEWAHQFSESLAESVPADHYGKTDFDLWPTATAQMIREEDQKIIQTGVTYETNEAGHDFEGNEKHWMVRKFLIPGGDPLIGGFVLEVTQQKQAEKALRESEERYRQLAETARVVPWEWSYEQRRYTYVGPQVATVFGYSHDEWTRPRFWEDSVHPTELEATLAYCHKQVQVADHYETEYRFRDASGNWRWIHDVVTVSRRDGHPEFLRGFMVDISASREVEEALRLSEGRLRSVMEHAPDIIIQVDREHKIQFINRILEPFALENTLGTQVEAWIPPSDSDSVRSEIDRVFATGNSGNYFTRFDHPTDGELWFSCNVGAVRVDGHVDSVILISRDITYQKRAEIAMRESEQLYRLLADHSSDMIARIYPNGVFAYVSPSAEIITGYRPEELLGKNFENLVPAEEIPRLYQEIGGVVNERREHVVTYRLIRKDGRVIWAESKGQPVVDPITNQVTELIVNTRDVTDRLEAARRLREREYHLAHAERLATMGQMASELAHEINQPLYAIANFADACNSTMEAASPSAADDVANWLTQIAIQARRASDIVRRINHFVRKGDAERSVFQINDCVHDVIPLFEINARRDGIRLELELQSDLPPVFADRLLLEQVLTNLIRNGLESIHEAEPKHKRLLVRTYFADGQGIFVAVTDNGTGIPQDRFEHLFEPYFTSKQDGTGMGLSICRATIEAHGGRIWATNNQERGATFQFLIPATTKNPAQSLKNSGPE